MRPKEYVRLTLLKCGRFATMKQLAQIRSVQSYLELGYWLERDSSGKPPKNLRDDESLFRLAISKITGNAPLYLEFGVFEGRSMRWWSEHLAQPSARLIGFDSFEGLPTDWRPGLEAGAFATDGPPQIDDPRVSFEVGWFEETLRNFAVPNHDQLIINVDSDLYSSAATVLRWAEPYLTDGTLIYFDEFPDRDHEMRAFMELAERSEWKFTPLAFGGGGTHWLFEVTR